VNFIVCDLSEGVDYCAHVSISVPDIRDCFAITRIGVVCAIYFRDFLPTCVLDSS